MTLVGWLQISLTLLAVLLAIKPLGFYMSRVFAGERNLLSPVFKPVERALYAAAGLDENREQNWIAYASGVLLFSLAGFLVLYGILRVQDLLPLNPQGFA
ncbi:MAG: potassium-transporting ATPase subunit KdpA, partial [Alphaproteobacteria bacterium]